MVCILSLEEKNKLELFPRNLENSTQFIWERMLTVTSCPMLQKSCVYMYMSPRSYLILVILDFSLTEDNMKTSGLQSVKSYTSQWNPLSPTSLYTRLSVISFVYITSNFLL